MVWLLIVIEIFAVVVLIVLLRYYYKRNTLARVRARLARERKAECRVVRQRLSPEARFDTHRTGKKDELMDAMLNMDGNQSNPAFNGYWFMADED